MVSHMTVTVNHFVHPAKYGGKAYWLSWLHQQGYDVPYAVFLPAVDTSISQVFKDESEIAYFKDLLTPMLLGDRYNVAVRSSATIEDAHDRSFAGQFRTLIGQMTFPEVMDSIEQVIGSLKSLHSERLCRMGVIVQKRIYASFSGVVFSSNPVTGAKNQGVISISQGLGVLLVSGRVAGEDILVSEEEDEFRISPFTADIAEDDVRTIWSIAKEIERKLGYPVDIEWCLEEDTGRLYLLQCRPATGILHTGDLVIPVSLETEAKLPATVIRNEKVGMRLSAEKYGVPVSKAHLVIINSIGNTPRIPDLDATRPTLLCKAFSTVLIYPEVLQGKIVRSFSGSETLTEAISAIARMSSEFFWTSVIIVQEVFDPKYTGMVKRIGDGFVVALARGHFVPKGLVVTSEYVLDLEGTVLHSDEVRQNHYFRILNGEIVEATLSAEESQISVPKGLLKQIILTFAPFINTGRVSVEFGILRGEENQPYVYLIDLVEERNAALLDLQMIVEGIISKGIITGMLVSMGQNDVDTLAVDLHFHDEIAFKADVQTPMILLCDKPDISLLEVVRNYNPKRLGFIFREGSVLCHLAIILREYGIPAIQVENSEELVPGRRVTIDAVTPGLSGRERVRYD